MATGIVKWYSEKKGFGFIEPEDGPDIFVHYTGINGGPFPPLEPGDRVEFDIGEGRKGPCAVNVDAVQ